MCITLRGNPQDPQSTMERWCVRIMLWSVGVGFLAFLAFSYTKNPVYEIVEGVASVVVVLALGVYGLYNLVRNRNKNTKK